MIKDFLIPNKKNRYKPYLLRKVAIVAYSVMLVFVNSFGGLIGISQAQASSITPANVISLTNQERAAWGLNTLQTNSQLSAAALAKANDMFEKQYWDHFGPNGESPWQFIRAAGYNYVYAGENLAKGFRTAEGVHEAWMASPTHKANIVSGNYKDIGVAVVEGVLLGKQTILVVQMFGNLTSEVFGATQTPPPATQEPTTTPSSEEKVVVRKESGEIKSIRITSPQQGAVVTDPSVTIKGDTTNVQGSYTVEIYDTDNLVGDTASSTPEWEFSKTSDWEEGDHNVRATLRGAGVSSDIVNFSLDSRAPLIDISTIKVVSTEDKYLVTFKVEGDLESLHVVLGSDIVNVEYTYLEADGTVSIDLNKEDVTDSVIVVLSDKHGNTSELDISEYFIEKESEVKTIWPILRLSTTDKISIAVVSFVLILLCIEIVVYWRRGRIKDAVNDMFTVGVWWLILTVAIFNGFSGVIN
jgi:hypothetical protein